MYGVFRSVISNYRLAERPLRVPRALCACPPLRVHLWLCLWRTHTNTIIIMMYLALERWNTNSLACMETFNSFALDFSVGNSYKWSTKINFGDTFWGLRTKISPL